MPAAFASRPVGDGSRVMRAVGTHLRRVACLALWLSPLAGAIPASAATIAIETFVPADSIPVPLNAGACTLCGLVPLNQSGLTGTTSIRHIEYCGVSPDLPPPFASEGWDYGCTCYETGCGAGIYLQNRIIVKANVCPAGWWQNGADGTCTLSDTALDPQKNNGSDCTSDCTNPINIGTGNKVQVETDYQGAGPFPLRFVRTYNSHPSALKASLGWRWRGNYHRSIKLSVMAGISTAYVRRPDGRTLLFNLNGGAWVPDADITDRLERLTDAQGAPAGWRYTPAPDDEVESYDIDGRLTAIANRAGLTHALAYDALGRLASVTHSLGGTLTFSYDAQDRIATVTAPGGEVFTLGYDGEGHLASIRYPDNKTRIYHYENPGFPHALTGITDENGDRFATWSYDGAGRATLSEHAGGANRVTVAYDPGISTVTQSISSTVSATRTYSFQVMLGSVRTLAIAGAACPGCGPAASSFDANGFTASRTDWNGIQTTYQRADAYGRADLETSRTEASGTPQARTVSTIWHPTFRLPTRITEPGRATDLTYDALGNLLGKTVTDLASGKSRVWTHSTSYSATTPGLVTQMIVDGPRTDVADLTTITYHPPDDPDPGKRGNLATMTNALGHTTSITAYDPHGRPLTIVDPNGLTTQLAYDARGRLLSRSVGGETTGYAYDGVGQLTQVTLPDSSSLTYTYDAAHRLTGITDSLGNRIVYTLDAAGNRTKEEVFDPMGALAQTRSRVYNSLNRLAQEIGAQNQVTQYSYDNQGNVTSVTDPLGRVTANAYDALNRLLRVTDPNSGQVNYGYNALDQLTSVTDPRNLVTSYAYDGLSNLNQQTSPDTGVTQNTYDAAGNLLTQTDAKGQTTSYAYDALNRVTQITFADGSKQVYAYDQAPNGLGRLSSITERNPSDQVTSAIAYAYDAHGRVTAETRTVAGVQYVLGYSYDGAGRLTGLTYPSGRALSYGFDALGRVNQVTTTKDSQSQVVVQNVQYQPFGGVKSYTLGSGQIHARSIDLDGRVSAYTLGAASFVLTFDPASRITGITEAGNPANANTYGYDSLDRLTSAVLPSSSFGYGYDAVGNRLTKTVGAATDNYTYSATSNRITSIAPASGPVRNFTFDANGSTVDDALNQYAYDNRGRMVQATRVVGATSYQVNALGQRIRKTNSSGDTVFHYDTRGRLIAETDPGGALKRELIYLGDIPVGVLQ